MIHIGYEVGSGKSVSVPLGHLCVTGQTQESGKTTTLEALATRSGSKVIAFVTKRGEGSFKVAEPLEPYFDDDLRHRDDGWLFVQRILESALDMGVKETTPYIIQATQRAKNLFDVAENVKALGKDATSKADRRAWMCLDAYLSTIMPELKELAYNNVLRLQPGLNVMDLAQYKLETQMLVVTAVLTRIMRKETGVIAVIPEAWQFVPQQRHSPVAGAANELIRKGAASRNFVWFDSQDMAGVDKTLFRQVRVWIFGKQRQSLEVDRTIDQIPNLGTRPRTEEIQTLKKGQFFVCYDDKLIKTYVQPAWMESEVQAQAIATGDESVGSAREALKSWERQHKKVEPLPPTPTRMPANMALHEAPAGFASAVASVPPDSPIDWKARFELIRDASIRQDEEIANLKATNQQLRDELQTLKMRNGNSPKGQHPSSEIVGADVRGHASPAHPGDEVRAGSRPSPLSPESPMLDVEALYAQFRVRLMSDPVVLRIAATRPEIEVSREEIPKLTFESSSTKGRITTMVHDGFFAQPREFKVVRNELIRRGESPKVSNRPISLFLDDLLSWGYLTRESGGYQAAFPSEVSK